MINNTYPSENGNSRKNTCIQAKNYFIIFLNKFPEKSQRLRKYGALQRELYNRISDGGMLLEKFPEISQQGKSLIKILTIAVKSGESLLSMLPVCLVTC